MLGPRLKTMSNPALVSYVRKLYRDLVKAKLLGQSTDFLVYAYESAKQEAEHRRLIIHSPELVNETPES